MVDNGFRLGNEQWGNCSGAKDTKVNVNFPIAFSSANYTVFGQRNYADSSHDYTVMVSKNNLSSFYLRNGGSGSYDMMWYSIGV